MLTFGVKWLSELPVCSLLGQQLCQMLLQRRSLGTNPSNLKHARAVRVVVFFFFPTDKPFVITYQLVQESLNLSPSLSFFVLFFVAGPEAVDPDGDHKHFGVG